MSFTAASDLGLITHSNGSRHLFTRGELMMMKIIAYDLRDEARHHLPFQMDSVSILIEWWGDRQCMQNGGYGNEQHRSRVMPSRTDPDTKAWDGG